MPEPQEELRQLNQLINRAQRLPYEAKQIMIELNTVLAKMEPLIRPKNRDQNACNPIGDLPNWRLSRSSNKIL
jgi:hypothetical protein